MSRFIDYQLQEIKKNFEFELQTILVTRNIKRGFEFDVYSYEHSLAELDIHKDSQDSLDITKITFKVVKKGKCFDISGSSRNKHTIRKLERSFSELMLKAWSVSLTHTFIKRILDEFLKRAPSPLKLPRMTPDCYPKFLSSIC